MTGLDPHVKSSEALPDYGADEFHYLSVFKIIKTPKEAYKRTTCKR